MNQKEFLEFYDNYNKKNNYEKYDDEYVDVEIYEGYEWSDPKNRVDFYKEFTKVFPEGWNSYIVVDDHLWFISNTETTYIGKDFLDFCIKNNLQGEKALDLYEKNLEINTWIDNSDNYIDDEATYNLMHSWKKTAT